MSELVELLERVKAATGPDRELDFRIHIAVIEDVVWPVRDRLGRITNPDYRMSDYLRGYSSVINSDDQDFDFPRYTSSIDAALALTERLLPGCGIVIDREPPAKGGAPAGAAVNGWIGQEGPEGRAWEHFDATGETFPLAILGALLSALIAQDPQP